MTILDKILAGLAAALLTALGVLLIMNADLRADLATAHANAATLNGANADLKAKAEGQNRAIAELQNAAEAKKREAERAVKAAQKRADSYTAKAAALGRQKPPGDDCRAAAELLHGYLEDAR